jgi:hypothetical protein
MPKASVVLSNGTKVTIDGAANEVAALVKLIGSQDDDAGTGGVANRRKGRGGRKTSKLKLAKPRRLGPTEYIRELKTAGYFKVRREIGEVRDKLEGGAHIYKVTSLSAPLFRLVKKKELRRVKEDGAWKYVNP